MARLPIKHVTLSYAGREILKPDTGISLEEGEMNLPWTYGTETRALVGSRRALPVDNGNASGSLTLPVVQDYASIEEALGAVVELKAWADEHTLGELRMTLPVPQPTFSVLLSEEHTTPPAESIAPVSYGSLESKYYGAPLPGSFLTSITITCSDDILTAEPVYLIIKGGLRGETFATSLNTQVQRANSPCTWYFDTVELSGAPLFFYVSALPYDDSPGGYISARVFTSDMGSDTYISTDPAGDQRDNLGLCATITVVDHYPNTAIDTPADIGATYDPTSGLVYKERPAPASASREVKKAAALIFNYPLPSEHDPCITGIALPLDTDKPRPEELKFIIADKANISTALAGIKNSTPPSNLLGSHTVYHGHLTDTSWRRDLACYSFAGPHPMLPMMNEDKALIIMHNDIYEGWINPPFFFPDDESSLNQTREAASLYLSCSEQSPAAPGLQIVTMDELLDIASEESTFYPKFDPGATACTYGYIYAITDQAQDTSLTYSAALQSLNTRIKPVAKGYRVVAEWEWALT